METPGPASKPVVQLKPRTDSQENILKWDGTGDGLAGDLTWRSQDINLYEVLHAGTVEAGSWIFLFGMQWSAAQ